MSAILRRSLLLPIFLLTACQPDTMEVVDSRAPFRKEPEPKAATEQQRFAENEMQAMFQWKKPEGWKNVKASEFRHISFVFGPAGEGECYVTVLSGSGGGVTENFNRWRGQFGLEPLKDEEVAALPTKMFLGQMVPVLDITGSYNGGPMSGGGGGPKADWRLVGGILDISRALITVKMTGPKALVEAEQKNLDAFLSSVLPAPNVR